MTTTLRPAGPEEQPDDGSPDGIRRRVYDICVNGRRAGGVELSATDENGLRTGRITHLVVDEADRRKGRATVAALAAEEVLRGWGCGRLVVAVPAAAGHALRLAAALGYTERSRHLLKDLSQSQRSGLPAGSRLTPVSREDFPAWQAHHCAWYAAALTADGVPPERAAAEAARAQEALLPDGPATPGMVLYTLRHRDVATGTLWLRVDGAPRPDADAWLYAVEVDEHHRRRGHGRTLLHAAEQVCREAGRSVLGLTVHAGNAAARALYESLGYRVAEHHLGKRLL